MFSTTNVSDKWNMHGFGRMLSYEQYPEEKSRLWLSSFKKKLIKLNGGLLDVTLNIYLKSCAYHPDYECCTFFHGIWATRSPLKIHWYTCMSFETCWSGLIYTKVSSHRSIVINMYVITMAWCCISPWSFHRSLQRRQEMDIFVNVSRFPRSEVKKQTKRGKPW